MEPRPPSERGQGRKTKSKTGETMKGRAIRMLDAEWEKCKKLGGGDWVRAKINGAKLPKDPPAE